MVALTEAERARGALVDELLAVRCQLGDGAAFDELIDRWHQPLWHYVRRFVDSDDTAADALQDIWLRVLRAMPRLREPAKLRAWLFGIARRSLIDRLRQRYAEPLPVSGDEYDIAGPEDTEDHAEELSVMHEELERMPFVEREALVLFYLKELTLAEMAEVLATPLGTVKSRLFRARQLLRRQLEDKGVGR